MNSPAGFAAAEAATSCACWISAAMRAWIGDFTQAGSVAAASPAIAIAWHRQPPQSISRRSQLRHGSCIHSVPRNALNAGESVQISASVRSPKRSKRERRNRLRGVARQHGAVRRYHEGVARPAAHARFRIDGEIVRRDEVDVHDAGEPFARRLDDVDLPLDRGAVRHQRIAIGERPAGILHIGDLKPFCVRAKAQVR